MKQLFLVLIFYSCSAIFDNPRFKFKVEDPKSEQWFRIMLEDKYSSQSIYITRNTLNDTCRIGIIEVPPGKTGRLYLVDFYADSLSYPYYPYKATEGALEFTHSFSGKMPADTSRGR